MLGRRIWIVFMSMALVAAGCGGDDPLTSEEQALADVFADVMIETSRDNPTPLGVLGRGEAECLSTGVLREVGSSHLESAGFDAAGFDGYFEGSQALTTFFENLDEGTAAAYVDVFLRCVDMTAGITRLLVSSGIEDEGRARCVAEAIVAAERFEPVMAEMIAGFEMSREAAKAWEAIGTEALTQCLSPDEMAELLGGG